MKQTKILSLIDQRHVMTSSLMWDLDHETLPPTLSTYFVKCNTLHHHNTRHANADKLHIKKTSTKKYGLNSFQVQGSLTLNSLKDLDFYNNATSKKSFLNNLKKTIFDITTSKASHGSPPPNCSVLCTPLFLFFIF